MHIVSNHFGECRYGINVVQLFSKFMEVVLPASGTQGHFLTMRYNPVGDTTL